jgi:hypothetical protein
MLSYYKKYTDASTSSSTVQINTNYEWILGKFLTWQGLSLGDKKRKVAKDEYYEAMEEIEDEEFTPTIDQARPEAAELTGYVKSDEFEDSEYIGT